MDEAQEQQEPVSGRRAAPRARIYLPARIQTLNGNQPAELIDLSATGAKVEVRDVPRIGSGAVMKCGPIDAFAQVVWNGAQQCGLEFDEPLSEAMILAARYIADHKDELQQEQEFAVARSWVRGD